MSIFKKKNRYEASYSEGISLVEALATIAILVWLYAGFTFAHCF